MTGVGAAVEVAVPGGPRLAVVARDAPVVEVRVLAPVPPGVDDDDLRLVVAGLADALTGPDAVGEVVVSVDGSTRSVVVALSCLLEDWTRSLHRVGEAVRVPGRTLEGEAAPLHRRVLDPAGLVVVVGGAVDPEAVGTAVGDVLAGLPAGPAELPVDDGTDPSGPGPDLTTAGVLTLVAPAPDVDADLWLGHHLGLGILGALGVGRLTRALRAEGLAYGASLYRATAATGPVTRLDVHGPADDTAAVLACVRNVLARYVAEGPTAEEVVVAREHAYGTAAVGTDALSSLVDAVAGFLRRDLPVDWLARSAARLLSATPADVVAAAPCFRPEAFVPPTDHPTERTPWTR